MILNYCCEHCGKRRYVNALDCYNHEAICNENPKLKKCFSCKHYKSTFCHNSKAVNKYNHNETGNFYNFLVNNTKCDFWNKKEYLNPFNFVLRDVTESIDEYVCEIDKLASKNISSVPCGEIKKRKCFVKVYLKHIGMSFLLCRDIGREMFEYISYSILNKFKEK